MTEHEPKVALRDAVERLYTVLARYPLNPTTEPCPHCHPNTTAVEAPLRAKPLRELSADDLSLYAGSALYTWGGVDDFRYFLPRILELHAENEFAYPDFESTMSQLSYARWQTWPEDERQAITWFLTALWRWLLAVPQVDGWHPPQLEECLVGIAQTVDDMSPFLDAWRAEGSLLAALHLAEYVIWNENELRVARLGNTYRDNERAMQQVVAWLREPATQQVLSSTATQHDDSPQIRRALEILQAIPPA